MMNRYVKIALLSVVLIAALLPVCVFRPISMKICVWIWAAVEIRAMRRFA